MRHMDEQINKAIIAEFLGEGFTETQVNDAYEYAEKVLSSLIDAHEIFANEFGTHFKFKQMEVSIILALVYFINIVSPEGDLSRYLKVFYLAFNKIWDNMIESAMDTEGIILKHSAEKP